MSKLIVDKIQKSGGASFSFPMVDGTAGQFLTTTAGGTLGWSTITTPVVPVNGSIGPELITHKMIGTLVSHTDRGNQYSTGAWSSSDAPNGSYYNNDAYTGPNVLAFINMALGDGLGSTTGSNTSYFWGNDSTNGMSRQLEFANGSRVGYARDFWSYQNTTDLSGHSFRIMPIRNIGTASIAVAVYSNISSYWSSGLEGACLFRLYPDTSSTLYSTVTSVLSERLAYKQNNSQRVALDGSFTILPGQTNLLCVASSNQYHTTYRFKDTNYFRYLNTTFSDANIICDLRMLQSLYVSRFNLPKTGSTNLGNSTFAPLWTMTATNFGDR